MPRRVAIFIEKTKDGQILPVPNVVVRDVACGANHTVGELRGFLAACAGCGGVDGLSSCLVQTFWVGIIQ